MRPPPAACLTLLLLLGALPGQAQPALDPWWGPDKAAHYGLSAALAGSGWGLAALGTEHRPLRLAVGASLALGAGLAKELLDLAGGGAPSWRDLAWDGLGTATGLLLAWALDLLLTHLAGPTTPAAQSGSSLAGSPAG